MGHLDVLYWACFILDCGAGKDCALAVVDFPSLRASKQTLDAVRHACQVGHKMPALGTRVVRFRAPKHSQALVSTWV